MENKKRTYPKCVCDVCNKEMYLKNKIRHNKSRIHILNEKIKNIKN